MKAFRHSLVIAGIVSVLSVASGCPKQDNTAKPVKGAEKADQEQVKTTDAVKAGGINGAPEGFDPKKKD
jgi:hypothetical protein